MTRNEVLKTACVEAENTFWKNCFALLDSEPDVIIEKSVHKRITAFIENLGSADAAINKEKTVKNRKVFKIILVAALIAVIAAVTAFSFAPVREFIVKVYDNCTELIFTTKNVDDYLYAEYSYTPECYKLLDNQKNKKTQYITYGNGKQMIFIDTIKNQGSVTGLNSENADYGEIKIGNYEGYYCITDHSIMLTWSTGVYNHTITADLGEYKIDLYDLVKIAESRHRAVTEN